MELFNKLEFTSLLKRLPKGVIPRGSEDDPEKKSPQTGSAKKIKTAVLKTKEEIDALLRRAHEEKIIGFNLLPNGADRITAGIAAALVALGREANIIPFDYADAAQKESLLVHEQS